MTPARRTESSDMGVKITKDNVALLMKAIKTLTASEVLVGVPERKTEREDEDGKAAEITNAALAYIHEFGAPEKNIPPRPFLAPGVESIKDQIAERLGKAAGLVLDGQFGEAKRGLQDVGRMAEDAVKRKITDGPFVPIKESTKRARLERRQAYKNASEKRKRKMMAAYLAGDFSPLIDTGALRASITHVIRKKGARDR